MRAFLSDLSIGLWLGFSLVAATIFVSAGLVAVIKAVIWLGGVLVSTG